jgi:hypothetical protein
MVLRERDRIGFFNRHTAKLGMRSDIFILAFQIATVVLQYK